VAETRTKRRRVKNPETFRERAIKASAQADRPAKRGLVRRLGGRVLLPVFRPISRVLRRLFDRQPFRFIGKILFPAYFRNSWHELQQVTWPNWRESRRLTGAVLIFAIIFGAAIALVDYGLDKVFRSILLK
jgi:preprotein translocase SecE subunit